MRKINKKNRRLGREHLETKVLVAKTEFWYQRVRVTIKMTFKKFDSELITTELLSSLSIKGKF